MKRVRQEKILELIANRDIDTQEGLAEALRLAGYPSTQATISRDMRELGLVKEIGQNGAYRYVATRQALAEDHAQKLRTIFRESVTEIAVAQNLVVIKTLPGLAPAACSAVDGMNYPGLIGTLAGDDTAFLAMASGTVAEQFKIEILKML